MSTLENENVSAAAVSILAGKLYEERLEARRAYEKRLMGEKTDENEFPMVWLFIEKSLGKWASLNFERNNHINLFRNLSKKLFIP